jgi:hypothetical protein
MTFSASWYGAFPDYSTWSAAEYTVSFAISGLLGNSSPVTGGDASLVGQTVGLTPTYILRLSNTATVNEMVEPQLVVSSITGAPVAGLTRVDETTVQLALGPRTLGCTLPASVDIVVGNGGVGCRAEMVPATAGVPGEYKWQRAYTPSDIANCGADVSHNNLFKLPMTLSVAYSKHWDAGSLPAGGHQVVFVSARRPYWVRARRSAGATRRGREQSVQYSRWWNEATSAARPKSSAFTGRHGGRGRAHAGAWWQASPQLVEQGRAAQAQ